MPPPADHVPDSEIDDDWYLNPRQTRRFLQEGHEEMLRQMDHDRGYDTPELSGPLFRTPARDPTLSMREIEARRAVVAVALADRHQVFENKHTRRFEGAL